MAVTAVLRTTTHDVAARSAEEHKRSSAQRTFIAKGTVGLHPIRSVSHKINFFRALPEARFSSRATEILRPRNLPPADREPGTQPKWRRQYGRCDGGTMS